MFRIIDAILAGMDPSQRLPAPAPPDGVRLVALCPVSGGLPNDHCPRTVEGWFIPGVSPIDRCSIHRVVHVDTRSGYRSEESRGPYTQTLVREFWPSDIMALFEQAGLPRLGPPPWPPENLETLASGRDGFPPRIVTPLSGAVYVLSGGFEDEEEARIVLRAYADADVRELFWFADERFLGKVAPNETLVWTPEPGPWTLSVVDSRGRSASRSIRVETREEQFIPGRQRGPGTIQREF